MGSPTFNENRSSLIALFQTLHFSGYPLTLGERYFRLKRLGKSPSPTGPKLISETARLARLQSKFGFQTVVSWFSTGWQTSSISFSISGWGVLIPRICDFANAKFSDADLHNGQGFQPLSVSHCGAHGTQKRCAWNISSFLRALWLGPPPAGVILSFSRNTAQFINACLTI
jgi:hypothetical protein